MSLTDGTGLSATDIMALTNGNNDGFGSGFGGTVPASTMIVTPAAVEEYFNVSTDILVPIVCGCCQSVTVTNLSTIPISMQNASITI